MIFIKNFLNSFTALTLVDYVFFFSVLALLILIVILIYFIKINKEEEIKDFPLLNEEPKVYDEAENQELLDLKTITKALEEKDDNVIGMTEYEEDQEKRAIISYEELLSKTSNNQINYETEEEIGDVKIRKVDLENLLNKTDDEKPKINVQVISYEKEEAFLETLKKLADLLL